MLIFNVTHTVTFGTHTGEDYQWELDILRSYDDADPVPGWASNSAQQVTASSSPVKIEWAKDNDVYKPIMGSKAKINLLELPGTTLPTFTNAGPYEYKVRLRYKRYGESTFNDYWTGFIQSLDSSRSINSEASQVSFTATDGLGVMEDSKISVNLESATSLGVFQVLTTAVYQTGLDLDIYVDSGIKLQSNSADYLTNATIHPHAYSEGDDRNPSSRKLLTKKEVIEGTLSAFNCRIVQSNGRWYIFNASSLEDNTTWEKYVLNNQNLYEYNSDVTESLVYNVGANSPDILVINGDIQRNTKLPFGSVECRPKNTSAANFILNGLLEDTADGYSVHPDSDHNVLYRVDAPNHPYAPKMLRTNRSKFDLGEDNDIWFRTDYIDVDINAPLNFEFDWVVDQLSSGDNIYLGYAIQLRTDNVVAVRGGFSNARGAHSTSTNVQDFVYDWIDDQWQPATTSTGHTFGQPRREVSIYNDYRRPASNTRGLKRNMCSATLDWQTVSEELNLARYYDPVDGQHIELSGQVRVIMFYPQVKESGKKDWVGDRTARTRVGATNFSLKNNFGKTVNKPVFERLQADYNKTNTYKPIMADGVPSGIVNKIKESGVRRSADAVNVSTTLERIVTQQKLNDYRNEFKYYEGSFVNISSDPISPINKINIDWNNYSETDNLIISGGSYDIKSGSFDIASYVPNQSTDIAPQDGTLNADGTAQPGFYAQDVDLVAEPFQGSSKLVTYSLAISADGIDDLGAALTTNPLSVDQYDSGVLTVTGYPGEILPIVSTINVDSNFELSASNLEMFDGSVSDGIWVGLVDGEDTAEHIDSVLFKDKGREVEITFNVEIPSESEFEVLRIRGEVDPFLESNRDFDLTFALDSGITNAVINNTTRNLRGIPGTNSFIGVIVTPAAGKELDATNYSVTTPPTGVTINSIEQMGTSVYLEIEVEFQADNATETVTISGTSATDIPDDVSTSTVSLTLTESITNVSISRTSLTLTGIVGTTAVYDVTAYAADTFELTASNFSLTESEVWLTAGNAVGGGETVLIPLEITFPSSDVSGTATISGSAQAIGADTVSIQVDFTNNVSNTSLIDASETFVLNHGQRVSYTNTLTPSRGFFMNSSDLTITETADVNNVIAFSKGDAGGGSINMSTAIVAPTSGSSVSAAVTLSGNVSSEPYLATVNLTESLPLGRITNNTLSQRFGASDSNLSFGGITVSPTTEGAGYPSGTVLTISGGTASNYSYSNGEITFDLLVPLPSFSSSLPVGNVAIDVSISAAGSPVKQSTIVEVNTTGLRNCTVTLDSSESLNTNIPFSSSDTTITVVASNVSGSAFDLTGTPITTSNNGSMAVTETQTATDYTATFTLTPQTTSSIIVISLLGGADLTSAPGAQDILRRYELTASSTQSTVFEYEPTVGSFSTQTVPTGDSLEKNSFSVPTIDSGSGNGAVATEIGIVAGTALTATTATNVNGISIVIGAAPATPAANTLYFS